MTYICVFLMVYIFTSKFTKNPKFHFLYIKKLQTNSATDKKTYAQNTFYFLMSCTKMFEPCKLTKGLTMEVKG